MGYIKYNVDTGVTRIKRRISGGILAITALAFIGVTALSTGGASALSSYVFFGDASVVAGGNPGNAAQLRSDSAIAPNYGGVTVTPTSPIPWSSLSTLSSDYNVTDDNCGGGSPRVQVRIDTNSDGISDGSVRIALGPSPSFTGCSSGWQSTGNLIGNSDTGRYDYSVFGGSPYTTYSNAPASVTAGQVVGVVVVVDGSWSAAATGGDSEQTTLVDNIEFNGDVTTFDAPVYNTPTNKDQCKKDGWKNFEDSNGKSFKNQGLCIKYVNQND